MVNEDFNYHLIRKDEYEYISQVLADDDLRRLASGPFAKAPSVDDVCWVVEEVPGTLLIIDNGSEKIGWFKITPVDGWEAGLSVVIADPAYRNRQVGRYLVGNVLLPMVFSCFKRAVWYTWDYNKPSMKVALRLGFDLVNYRMEEDGSMYLKFSLNRPSTMGWGQKK